MNPFEVFEMVSLTNGYEVKDWCRIEGLGLCYRAIIFPRGWKLLGTLFAKALVWMLTLVLTLFMVYELHTHGLTRVVAAGSIFVASAWYAATRPMARTLQVSYDVNLWRVESDSYIHSNRCVKRALEATYKNMDPRAPED